MSYTGAMIANNNNQSNTIAAVVSYMALTIISNRPFHRFSINRQVGALKSSIVRQSMEFFRLQNNSITVEQQRIFVALRRSRQTRGLLLDSETIVAAKTTGGNGNKALDDTNNGERRSGKEQGLELHSSE